MNVQRKVLICPLDWGLGHASRCIPIIRSELAKGNKVYLAANGRAKDYLQRYFPEVPFLPDPPAYNVHYSLTLPLMLHLVLQVPKIMRAIWDEHKWLKQCVKAYSIDEVISDNRYGLYHSEVTCSLITHQTAPIVPVFVRPIIHSKIKAWCERFDQTWIPDDEETERSLGGQLSHANLPNNARYIGLLSRFQGIHVNENVEKYTNVVLVSGPEPERTRRWNEVYAEIEKQGDSCFLLSGIPGEPATVFKHGLWSKCEYPSDETLSALLRQSDLIWCGSGYSSIMDMHVLGVAHKVKWFATSGQTEQEYLLKLHNKVRL
jgi:hypothetical protein